MMQTLLTLAHAAPLVAAPVALSSVAGSRLLRWRRARAAASRDAARERMISHWAHQERFGRTQLVDLRDLSR